MASAETGRAGGGRGWRRQSIRLLIRLTTGRHQKKINPICPITPPDKCNISPENKCNISCINFNCQEPKMSKDTASKNVGKHRAGA
ncbi:hypothetical protein ACET3Z_016288 [Daucus carota]